MIRSVTGGGALPALERAAQFAAARQEFIAHNIANLSTPGFRPVDVSVKDFQASLEDAVEVRRDRGEFRPEDTAEVTFEKDRLRLAPSPIGANLLFHDGNDRSLEHLMQDLSENFLAFRFATSMLSKRLGVINTAIRGRL